MVRRARKGKNVENSPGLKCQTCRKEYSPACDYRQGRCPHHPSLLNNLIAWLRRKNNAYLQRIKH